MMAMKKIKVQISGGNSYKKTQVIKNYAHVLYNAYSGTSI